MWVVESDYHLGSRIEGKCRVGESVIRKTESEKVKIKKEKEKWKEKEKDEKKDESSKREKDLQEFKNVKRNKE